MYTRAEIIQKIINQIGARRYLEIGVAHAETFLAVDVDNRIGVDPARPSQRLVDCLATVMAQSFNRTDRRYINCRIDHTDVSLSVKNCSGLVGENTGARQSRRQTVTEFYQLTSDEFFAKGDELLGSGGIDVAFVDGLHEWKQVVRDVENCLRYLNDGGVIVMHDCSPTSALVSVPPDKLEEARRSAEWNGAWTGDVWKAVAWLRSCRADLRLFVVDCDWGVGILTRGKPTSMLDFDADSLISASYDLLDSDRDRILNLKEPRHLDTILGNLTEVKGQKKTLKPGHRNADRVLSYLPFELEEQ